MSKTHTILVTGGCGFIGSHTLVDLVKHGFNVVSIDNNSRSTGELLKGVSQITGREIVNHPIDLCKYEDVRDFFRHHSIDGIIHFAAFKSVDESVKVPVMYYENNFVSQINLMKCSEEFNVSYFVFSSSCSVYGNADSIPVTEETPFKKAESPYGMTKQVGENMLRDFSKVSKTKLILLRYFNPVGAHPSGIIGEVPFGRPSNLVPAITQFAAGKLPQLKVFGTDYNTRDGSCVRDFIHVCDIAHAHTLALEYLVAGKNRESCEVFNLGTGNGVTVLEAIAAFERVTQKKLNYVLAERRPGDVVAVYANNEKARYLLGWIPEFTLDDMMSTAWKWEISLSKSA